MLKLTARPSPGNINTPFGPRPKPTQASPAIHYGQDYGWGNGKEIYAAADGIVVEGNESGLAGAYGNRTRIDHGDGYETWYCHQSAKLVRKGQRVKAGQRIGTQGATGNVTGVHLHFEVRLRGVAVNPAPYFILGESWTAPPATPKPQEDTLSDAQVERIIREVNAHTDAVIAAEIAQVRATLSNLIGIVTREGRGPGVARVYVNVDTGETAIGAIGQFWQVLPAAFDELTVNLFAADGFSQGWADRKPYPTGRYEFARMICNPETFDSAKLREQLEGLGEEFDEIRDDLARIEAEAKADDPIPADVAPPVSTL